MEKAAPAATAAGAAAAVPPTTAATAEPQKLVHEGWSDIREKPRGCTDVLFVLILLCTWFAMSIIGLIVTGCIKSPTLPIGNPYRLLNSVDYTNRICGFNDGLTTLPYGYYLPDQTSVCVASCPAATDYTKFVCKYDLQSKVDGDKTKLLGFYYLARSQCMYFVKSTLALNRCVPAVDTGVVAKAFIQQLNLTGINATAASRAVYPSGPASTNYVSNFWEDVLVLIQVIAPLGLGLATVLSFGYLYFLRIPGLLFVLVWTILITIEVVFILLSVLLFVLSTQWAKDGLHTHNEIVTMQTFASLGFAVSFLYFCTLLWIEKFVRLALSVVKEACRTVASMPLLVLLPVLQVVGMTLFLIPWFMYMIYLASSGTTVFTQGTNALGQPYTYRKLVYTQNTQYTFIFMLFVWFWTAQFVVAVGQCTIALACVGRYFTRDKSKVGNGTVLWALGTVFRYHLGTVACGSLIIAVAQLIRRFATYLQKYLRSVDNQLIQCLMCCVQCLMCCCENVIKFISKNAYIQTALFGYPFCKGARSALGVLTRNVLRVASVNMVGEFVLLMGKVLVPTATTFIAYLIVAYGIPSNSINYIVAPLVLVWLLAFFVASWFSEVVGMTIDTILFCFVADEEMFPVGQRFAENALADALADVPPEKHNPKVAVTAHDETPSAAAGGGPAPVPAGK